MIKISENKRVEWLPLECHLPEHNWYSVTCLRNMIWLLQSIGFSAIMSKMSAHMSVPVLMRVSSDNATVAVGTHGWCCSSVTHVVKNTCYFANFFKKKLVLCVLLNVAWNTRVSESNEYFFAKIYSQLIHLIFLWVTYSSKSAQTAMKFVWSNCMSRKKRRAELVTAVIC